MSETQAERKKIAQELADYISLPCLESGEVTINDVWATSKGLTRRQVYRKLEALVEDGLATRRVVYLEGREQNAYRLLIAL